MLDDGLPYRAILQKLVASPSTTPSLQHSNAPSLHPPLSLMNLSNWFHGGYQDWRRSNSSPTPNPEPNRTNSHQFAPIKGFILYSEALTFLRFPAPRSPLRPRRPRPGLAHQPSTNAPDGRGIKGEGAARRPGNASTPQSRTVH
jgi:hypothetical protein